MSVEITYARTLKAYIKQEGFMAAAKWIEENFHDPIDMKIAKLEDLLDATD